MKSICSINRSGKSTLPVPPTSPSGVEILPQVMGVVDYEVFLVAKGLSTFGVGALISPDDYYSPEKSLDVYALLCARPEDSTVLGKRVKVYPVFFIAKLAGMSKPFSIPGEAEECRTLCLDVVQRVGVGDNEAPIQRRIFMNLRVHDPQVAGHGGMVFRPSWDRYISTPNDNTEYEKAAFQVEWPISEIGTLTYQVKDREGGILRGPYHVSYQPLQASLVQLRTRDIHMKSDWTIWCGQATYGPSETPTLRMEFAGSLSNPFGLVVGEGETASGYVWMCLLVVSAGRPSLTPIAYQPVAAKWGNISDIAVTLVGMGVLVNQ